MSFKDSEFSPLCEIVASLHALFLPLHICAGVLYMGSVQKSIWPNFACPMKAKYKNVNVSAPLVINYIVQNKESSMLIKFLNFLKWLYSLISVSVC